MSDQTVFTTPVGRLVGGSLYKPQDKDADGKPLLIKNGPNTGKPTVRYWIPVAIAKGQEQHWNQTQWGAAIWNAGVKAFPQAHQSPAFAWKVVDGDSQTPNKRGRKPCDNEGWARHWVLMFGGSYAPKVVNRDGSEHHPESDYCKPGYYVQVLGSVSGNGSQQNPGVYLNYAAVSMQAFGEEIQQGPDLSQAGFGQAPLPPGASVTPVGGFESAAPAPMAAPAPVYVQPNPAFLNPAPAPVAPPPAPAAPAGPVMTPKAQGVPYQAYIDKGWTDDLLRQHGMMV